MPVQIVENKKMRIAVISDTHDRTVSVVRAVKILAETNVDAIIHCGDICDGDTVRLFPAHTHFVFGNCDYLRDEIEQAITDIGATLHGAWGHLELAGCPLAFTHGDDHQRLYDLEHADAFEFVFHGHTHIAKEHRTGKTRVINPGALQRVARRTFIILDLPAGAVETITVD
jgi:putative phosphoesterase